MNATVSSSAKRGIRIDGRTITIVLGVIIVALLAGYYIRQPLQATAVYAATLRQSTPLILGALCGLIGERSGVINIGIEGQMLLAAFLAFLANVYIGRLELFPLSVTLLLALLIGVASGAIMGLFLAWMSVGLKMDQIIGGTVINGLAVGITSFFYQTGLTTQGKFQPVSLGFLSDLPLVGPVFFTNAPITFLAIILVFVMQFALFRTVWGLRTRSVGEHPSAADTVGINVHWTRYVNVTIAGCFAGLAGAYLTLEAVGSFERGMTNGRGFIALACMIFGKWTPLGSWGAALLFAFFTALQTQLQFTGGLKIPHQFLGMLPYILTIIVLAGFVGRSRAPAAVGQVYESE
jgi:simple sugar transport system permease protein